MRKCLTLALLLCAADAGAQTVTMRPAMPYPIRVGGVTVAVAPGTPQRPIVQVVVPLVPGAVQVRAAQSVLQGRVAVPAQTGCTQSVQMIQQVQQGQIPQLPPLQLPRPPAPGDSISRAR